MTAVIVINLSKINFKTIDFPEYALLYFVRVHCDNL